MIGMQKSRSPFILIVSVIFIASMLAPSLLIEDVHAAGPETPSLVLEIDKITRTENNFIVKGTVTANGPHDREQIFDVYSLWVEIIIKDYEDSRYPNFKEWAYEPESIAAYYPDAETPYTPGSGPGDTMTSEEAYGINVTTIELFSSSELGEYDFEGAIPVEHEGNMFRIQATLQWDYKGKAAYWWAHRFFNKIGCEGNLGESYEFLYSDGAEIMHADGRKEGKFNWKTDWPSDENLSFTFTKTLSYLGLCGGSIIGDESVSGKITSDKITIKKSSSDIPVEFTFFSSHYLIAGEGEVSIVPKIYDENGELVCKGWGDLTDEVDPEEWARWAEPIKKKTEELAKYVWEHKLEISISTGGGLFIKVTTGIPGFLLTIPTKYAARALGYLTTPETLGQEWIRMKTAKKFPPLSGLESSWEYPYNPYAQGTFHSDGYIEVNEDTTTVYVTEGEATLADINNTKTVNITSGKSSTIKAGGVPTDPEPFNEDEVRERSGITMDTLIPEFPSWAPMLIMLIAVLAIAVIYRRRLHKNHLLPNKY